MKFEKIENCDNTKNSEISEAEKNIENCEEKAEKISLNEKFSKSFDDFKNKFGEKTSDFLIKNSEKIVTGVEVFNFVAGAVGAYNDAHEMNQKIKYAEIIKNEIVNERKMEALDLDVTSKEAYEKIEDNYNLKDIVADLGMAVKCFSDGVFDGSDEFKESNSEINEDIQNNTEYSDKPPDDE